MWWKWFPWKFVVKRFARSQGFLDPFVLLSRFNQFAQPSEVWAPLELMRAGAILHARGLINSQVIQHNLDWVWPYWVEKQFDPKDPSFIPRAFSLTHINLSHRNWTAVGIPGEYETPIVDSRGLVMPFYDSWSIDCWVIIDRHKQLVPSRLKMAEQQIHFDSNVKVVTDCKDENTILKTTVETSLNNGIPYCKISIKATLAEKGYLAIAVRPYNPEGISFIHDLSLLALNDGWLVNKKNTVFLQTCPDHYLFSNYNSGDVYQSILSDEKDSKREIRCDVGMATSAAVYECTKGEDHCFDIAIPLENVKKKRFHINDTASKKWENALLGAATCKLHYKNYEELYNNALYTLMIHSPDTCYAGPYTYKRFWFRDAAFICYALLCAGVKRNVKKIIDTFYQHQTSAGYFRSQDGEWDSNGQVLWTLYMYYILADLQPEKKWIHSVTKATDWLIRKRNQNNNKSPLTRGLLPPGFSAEHLGPNDYYYWDNFWGIGGLIGARWLNEKWGLHDRNILLSSVIDEWIQAVNRSLNIVMDTTWMYVMPASPHRRPDSGSIGSLVSGYPLQIWSAKDEKLTHTADYLYSNCCINSAFYHDISHSGINPYLTIHLAQTFLRSGDVRFIKCMESIASLATSTCQWPEAIHPQLKTGCMGDGQHVWAASEWLILIRNIFIREEGDKIILCSGLYKEILDSAGVCSFGPTLTNHGTVNCKVRLEKNKILVEWDVVGIKTEPEIIVAFPNMKEYAIQKGVTFLEIPYWSNDK
jgi:hypothetical protein